MTALTVSGGGGSLDARTTDMRAQARVLDDLAQDVRDLAARVAGVPLDPAVLASGLYAPVGLARIQASAVAAQLPPAGLAWLALEYEATGCYLRGAADAYDAVDAALAEAAEGLRAAAGEAILSTLLLAGLGALAVGGAGWAATRALPGGARDDVDAWLAQLAAALGPALVGGGAQLLFDQPWVTDTVLAGVPALVNSPGDLFGLQEHPLSYESVVALLLAAGTGAGLFHHGPVAISRRRRLEGAAPRSVADVFANLDTMSGPAESQEIRVTHVVGPAGESRFVVEIPGTESWEPRSTTNPADVKTNLQEIAGQESAMRAAVELALADAMEAAGIPPGERGRPEVLLAGHSQAGIVAVNLASDPDPAFRYSHVLVGGSPISLADVPESVHVLALEHEQDPVPRLDGVSNAPRHHVTTVVRDIAGEVPADLHGAQNPATAHDLELYRRTGAVVDASQDPAVAQARDGLAPFFTGTASATWSYEATQEPTP
ncbi:hypothetical protein ATJ97_1419 [Georgenia soli]|uniref:PGAP1-like protein n=1 Tax=Georgenia soli TaxID=638953 RepID=A0A2A9EIM2_9MICO|nr:hypothetical protein [Georgenia soli]PFG38927.1 hypothetical protein ATJ97_1419 [Georgenia soli]